ncbi:MAG: alpha/beta fold hydrolase [Pseudomonadota bacterium]
MADLPLARATGPSPLPAHLGVVAHVYRTALSDAALDPGLADDVARAALTRMDGFLDGVDAWRTAPRPPKPARPTALWRRGNSSLHAYGARTAPPVLVVPSLINRAEILDLTSELSMLRGLARQGLNPVLLDWGAPCAQTEAFGLADYIAQRLLPALDALTEHVDRKPALLGYCLGGTMSAALLSRRPDAATSLICLAAPWAFPRDASLPGGGLRAAAIGLGAHRLEALLTACAASFGCVPGLVYQSLFAAIDPMQALPKFRAFAQMRLGSAQAQRFVAVEDWLAANRDTTLAVARDVLIHLQMEDRLAKGRFDVLGGPVNAGSVTVPSLVLAGQRDNIAPPALAQPLAEQIPSATLLSPDLGHVGAIVSARAPGEVWDPIAQFLVSKRR